MAAVAGGAAEADGAGAPEVAGTVAVATGAVLTAGLLGFGAPAAGGGDVNIFCSH